RVVGKMAGHAVLPWIHRVFSLMKRWGLGTYHGLRRKHVDTYLHEFVFRYNRRFYRHASFEKLLGLTARHAPSSYWDIVGRANPRKGAATTRQVLKTKGYVTAQFGKNHLGDLEDQLPHRHGFDEFFGNLYHLSTPTRTSKTPTGRPIPSSARDSIRAESFP